MREYFIQAVTLLGLIGIPSIFSMTMFCIKKCNIYTKQLAILMKAQKAQMRAQLIKDFDEYIKRGWISNIELDEWMNQYEAYHVLQGPNGVLDNRKNKLLELQVRQIPN